jgi:predicted ATPase/DNA-binding CsgD family transcriptional regulator
VSHPVPNDLVELPVQTWRTLEELPNRPPGMPPAPLTALIGREQELVVVRRLLASDDVRLVTLTGPGGVGKTRLAQAVAAEVGAPIANTVVFVPLAPVLDTALVAATIADRLDIRASGTLPLAEEIVARLRGERTLLVLDNFEHLLAAAPLVTELLVGCPALTVLATSRHRLSLTGEHEVPVSPLRVPDPHQPITVEALAAVPAIRLFVARAQAAAPSFQLTEANGPTVAEICRRLDGLPLAIELAAPRTRLLSPAALLSRLTNRLQLLTGGPRDAPARLQTMRQAIAWSYDLLDPPAQALLRRVAVFPAGFTIQAVETIAPEPSPCAGGVTPADSPSLLDAVTALVDESLVQVAEQGDGDRRFEMLETVREYALERLDDAGEGTAARQGLAAYCLGLVANVDPWQSIPQASLERFQTEHDNLRAALAWSLANAPQTALHLVAGFWRFWWQRGYWDEGRDWLDRALAAGGDAPVALRTAALAGAGSIARDQGDFAQSRVLFEKSLALARQSGDERYVAGALRSLGIVASHQSEFGRAVALFEAALARLRLLQDQPGIARCLTDLGLVAERQGDFTAAIVWYEEALPLARAFSDETFFALLLSNLAGAVVGTGDWARGEALSEEALEQSRQVGDQFGAAVNLYNLADCAYHRGDVAVAWSRYWDCLAITAELGERHLLSRILDRMGHLLTVSGLPRMGAHLLGAAATLRHDLGDALFPIEEESVSEAIDATRAALGDEAFQAAWEVGASLSPDRAVAEVLAIDLPPPVDDRRAILAAQVKFGLTAREAEVLHLVAAGWADKEIAATLAISHHTASKHVRALRAKLAASSRTGAVATARQAGLL